MFPHFATELSFFNGFLHRLPARRLPARLPLAAFVLQILNVVAKRDVRRPMK
jgi:hypothetical protein